MGDVVADPWRMSATELAGAISHRQVSSREVVQAHLQRVEAINPGVNAITVPEAFWRQRSSPSDVDVELTVGR
jgi:Asp-tRNA(Asn)/Glu-tRNA(Gln) amidotransferase A subunit family amidase